MSKFKVTLNNHSIMTGKIKSSNFKIFEGEDAEKKAYAHAKFWESQFPNITKAVIEKIED